ncbi:hypothetical protein SAMD00019534_029620 [Acytostelium subglobosum LB1]|uniref:hypothetical protein n=1 Tax=Acytostelium subglobosum LB1 TaxID=1410327 RepID=UPI0006448EA4|nr:hypothetical protein SAMD00019534_029620 [Acytostelium subglobosum LB1]GAM19787.1 hypothetical protein SAMD00019534_029620 [Acytostelium subglobosum LB1]|eukprot:XP_012756549.1 hypothetical protein SAMD00019534_029620 [Acytostelium subglobosum LB1]
MVYIILFTLTSSYSLVNANKYLCNVDSTTKTPCPPFSSSTNNINNNGEENCDLSFDIPSQVIIAPFVVGDTSVIDCQGYDSFISRVQSTTLLNGLNISNAVDSCVNVPMNSFTFTLIVTYCSFTNCSGENGGAISITYPNSLNVMSSHFTRNTAKQEGGAIYADSTVIKQSTFQLNHAQRGGAVFSPVYTNSELTVRSSMFASNIASDGAAIYSTEFDTYGTFFHDNFANGYGGAIYCRTIAAAGCTFSMNSATLSGGAIALIDAFRANILSDTEIYNNTAYVSGGAIYIDSPSNKSTLGMASSKVYNNMALAEGGGGAFLNHTYNGYLIGGSFFDNTSPLDKASEIGCDASSESFSCNFCKVANCSQCTADGLEGICLPDPDTAIEGSGSGSGVDTGYLCMISTHRCVYGMCHVDSDTNNYSCECDSGWTGQSCDVTPTQSPTPKPTKRPGHSTSTKVLDILLPIFFGILLILFVVTLYIMIKKKKHSGYSDLLG